MAQRSFESGTFPVDGKPVGHSLITCRRCGVTARYKHAGFRKPPEAIEQYFRNHGWEVGKNAKADTCPTCQASGAAGEPKAAAKHEPDKPRDMSREERRIIFTKIDEVYLEEKSGYSPPWTDSAVARDLGVPRNWVSQVREELFGPEGSNQEFDDFLAKAAPVITDLKNLHRSVAAQLEEARKIAARCDELERVARRIEKEIGK